MLFGEETVTQTVEQGQIETVLGRLPLPVLLADDSGRYVFANEAACTLAGRPLETLLGLSFRDLTVDPVEAEISWRQFLSERQQAGQLELARPSGETVPVTYMSFSDFAPGLHVSVLNDLTEQIRVQEDVRRNEEIYGKAFRGSPVPMNIRRLDNGALIDVNEAFCETLGYWRSDLIGRTPESIGLWKDPSKLDGIMANLRDGQPQFRARAELVTNTGETKELAGAFQRIAVGDECLVIAVYTDISAYS